MTMPWQLAKAKRPHKSLRPIIEQLPAISVNDLGIPSLFDTKTYVLSNASLKYSHIASIRLCVHFVEFQLPSLHRGKAGPIHTFQLKHIRTGIGNYNGCGVRHALVCQCGKPTIKLYYWQRQLGCQRCVNARWTCQAITPKNRPVLQALRLASFLDSKPRLKHTRQRLEQRFGLKVLKAQGKYGTDARSLWD
jgi:hypothetical protein